jgi:hypothetical protein
MTLPSGIAGGQWGLCSVWGSSASNVFAGGSGSILHYDGSSWSAMMSGADVTNFSGIAGGSASDAFAVGSFGAILHYRP